jgi:alkanesulfonate monooxygenase SsuD/methylene tetrahydromethanopterin reductase-like flavin-dependent oxidoreductase (luciferase family)
MIDTWAFYFFTSGSTSTTEGALTPAETQEVFDRYMKLWIDCEGYGFHGLAFAEHHFNPITLSPSTHLLVAALAPVTKNLRLTTLGSVLAMHDSRRWVEEVGMLDYLTGGRYEPGIAPGAGDTEAVMAGIPSEDVRPRYYSGAELLEKVIAGPTVTHHDAYYNLEQVPIVPRMREETGRSTWTTVMSPASAAWSAERGFKMCTAWLPTPVAATLADSYRAAADAANRPVDPSKLGIRRRVFVADSDAEAQEKHAAATDYVLASVGQGFETADPQILALMAHPDDFAVGSVATVTEKLVEQCRAGGFGSLMAFPDFAGFSHEDLVRSHELIGREVAPSLRSVDVGARTSAVAV